MADLAGAPITAFLAITDAARAKAFYQDVVGLTLSDDGPFGLVFELAGAELRLSLVPAFTPFPWTVLDWQVSDLDSVMADLRGKGVSFERFPGMELDVNGVWTVPGGATRIAWFKDPDGNVLSVSHRA